MKEKLLRLLFVGFCIISMTGSYISFYNTNDVFSDQYISEDAFNETLISFFEGKGAHQDTLYLQGKKYAYEVNLKDDTNNKILSRIFYKIDSDYLHIGQLYHLEPDEFTDGSIQRLKPIIAFDADRSTFTYDDKFSMDVVFLFVKPLKLLTISEQSNLEQLGFECENIDLNLQCTLEDILTFKVLKEQKQKTNLVELRDNIILNGVYTYQKVNYGKIAFKLIYPLVSFVDSLIFLIIMIYLIPYHWDH
ncbi:hypothetical protein SKM57_03070 [Acinetobacter faecalis]|uniref:hypothetical protein n=1 Tax=Acinetobacter faecalis TaxID=2665161 RepID=UPI002A9112CC|nr:hypothetical protein [Acinetobacter faecalis]MDY6458060.1 hypothetical protein [Acinetobacter faecalis]MDY6467566.1 hypothetical protein [Acinetobacter faecalis]